MSSNLSNLKVLIAGPKIIQQGIVNRALDGNKYLVDLGSRCIVKAFYNGALALGQLVVVGKAPSGWEVLTSRTLAAKGIVEVKIR